MKLSAHGITATIVGALILGFLIPLSAGLVYSLLIEQSRLESARADYHAEVMANLERATENALSTLEPDEAQNAAKILMQDRRILHIRAYSRVYDMVLADLSRTPSGGEHYVPMSRTRDVIRNGETIGTLEVVIDGNLYTSPLVRERLELLLLFAGMLLCGLLLILPTVYFKILRPVARLMQQAENLSAGDLDTALTWTGRDELSRLGNTMDQMRRCLQTSFQRIQDLAVTDELTHLPNRRAFQHEAGRALELGLRYERPLTLVIIDLDHFKQVNDTWGHPVGDAVLQDAARIIHSSIRRTDICARIGGEEFALCMPETDLQDAEAVTEKIRTRIAAHAFAHNQPLTASFGLAPLMPDQTLDSLMLDADLALYQAKHQGRNQVVIFSNGQPAHRSV